MLRAPATSVATASVTYLQVVFLPRLIALLVGRVCLLVCGMCLGFCWWFVSALPFHGVSGLSFHSVSSSYKSRMVQFTHLFGFPPVLLEGWFGRLRFAVQQDPLSLVSRVILD
ncbi:hypothetical protein ISN44_As12g005000 [Arabidopsis suecica]|uniref:Transmembrane protein n=1 Tax=Arabidopsis suecica TaxID=45249 RepID=A0A8T1YFP5_ARASU|nr:hypothetical protein ISN44_As12g005000 [Arabidopsis suecica]